MAAKTGMIRAWSPLSLFAAGLIAGGAAMGAGGWSLPLIGGGGRSPQPAEGRESIPDMIERVSPGVVGIGAVRTGYAWARHPHSDFFSPFLSRRVPVEQRVPFLGSGFLIDGDGHVLTNYHVISGAASVFVTLMDGREVEAAVLDADQIVDLALLRVESPDGGLPPALGMGDSGSLRIGETTVAFGNPFGNLIADPRPTVTKGVVSALGRDFAPDRRNLRVYQDMIQTDAAINPGNSGGPLVDAEGRVVGVNTFILSRGGSSAGIGFAIPINRARAFVSEIVDHGRIRPLAIDFGVMRADRPGRAPGALVNYLAEGGPAEAAGLELGDIIVRVDGRPVGGREDVLLLLASRTVGDTVRLDVVRHGEPAVVEYTMSEAPPRENRLGPRVW